MNIDELVHAVPGPCAHIDANGMVDAMNPPMAGVFGAAIQGRHYITALRQPALIDRIEAALGQGARQSDTYLGRDGERETTYAVEISPISGDDGSAGVLIFFEDRTQVEEAEEQRTEFVANVSHELRTPLTAISGFIETLKGPARDDTEARDRFLDIMEHETRRMHRLVDDLLSLARVEDTERIRPMDDVDLAELVAGVAQGLAPQAQARAVTLGVSGCDATQRVPGDPDQLTQVFTNLIENAIKYGREGGRVQVTLKRQDWVQILRGPGLQVSVRDEGEGIDPRHLGRLTERFYRVDSHRSRGMGGTGLGLAIVKHILSRHRGRLRIESTRGQGSVFTAYLPLE